MTNQPLASGQGAQVLDHPVPATPDVDVSLIDEMLRLSPEERILFHDGVLAGILELRRAVEGDSGGTPT